MAFTPASSLSPATVTVAGVVSVSNFPAIQPVSGTVDVSNLPADQLVHFTQPITVDASGFAVPITAAALPLPAGAATEATLAALAAEAATEATLETLATEETAARANSALNDVALTAILEREKPPA